MGKIKDSLSIAGATKNYFEHRNFKKGIEEAKRMSKRAIISSSFSEGIDNHARITLAQLSRRINNLEKFHESLRLKHNLVVKDLFETKKRLFKLERKSNNEKDKYAGKNKKTKE